MALFDRFRRRDDRSAADVDREVAELLDPYGERTYVADGGGKAIVDLGHVLQNIHERMERFDLAPTDDWAPGDFMSLEESDIMIGQLGMGELVITETAWYARQVLSRWPADVVEHQIPPQATIGTFLMGVNPAGVEDAIGRQIINRALASADKVGEHPELDDLDADTQVRVWLGVVYWFIIKSMLLNKRDRGEL